MKSAVMWWAKSNIQEAGCCVKAVRPLLLVLDKRAITGGTVSCRGEGEGTEISNYRDTFESRCSNKAGVGPSALPLCRYWGNQN